MTLNLTVLFQILHFFIAYYIFKRLFLAPALAVIQKRDKHVDALNAALAKQKATVTALRTTLDEEWRLYQDSFHKSVPVVDDMKVMVPEVKEAAEVRLDYKPKELKQALKAIVLERVLS